MPSSHKDLKYGHLWDDRYPDKYSTVNTVYCLIKHQIKANGHVGRSCNPLNPSTYICMKNYNGKDGSLFSNYLRDTNERGWNGLLKKLRINATSDRCPEGPGWVDLPPNYSFSGCLYFSINDVVATWDDAVEACHDKGARLVEVEKHINIVAIRRILINMDGEDSEIKYRGLFVFTAGRYMDWGKQWMWVFNRKTIPHPVPGKMVEYSGYYWDDSYPNINDWRSNTVFCLYKYAKEKYKGRNCSPFYPSSYVCIKDYDIKEKNIAE